VTKNRPKRFKNADRAGHSPSPRPRRVTLPVAAGLVFAGLFLIRFGLAQTDEHRVGAQRFGEYCAACHGIDGKGGDKAASLAMTLSAMTRSDAELEQIVRNGTAEGMPPFAQIGDANIQAVVHYLRKLKGDADAAPVTGDVHAGRALFFGKAGCAACHKIGGDGEFIASDLTEYSRSHGAREITEAIRNPDNPVPRASQVATVTTRDGKTLTGILRYEDNFSLALESEDGRYHLLSKNDVRRLEYAGHSLMPRDYSERLSAAELNDIVSFLVVAGRSAEIDTSPPH